MRVLLDECVPRALRDDIPGHEVKTVAEVGWAGVKNGELLRLAATAFDVLITVDRNLEYQQSFKDISLAVIVVRTSSNDIVALRPLMPAVVELIAQVKPGVVTHVGGW
jgi:predicted nuclease of predicted toxin-antitoxin system